MKCKVTKAQMWMATVEDRAGGAADKLEPLARAGASFEFVFARRTPENPGKGLLIVYPVAGAKLTRAAQEAGFIKPADLHAVRIEGGDKAGMCARMMRALANAGISFRGMPATAFGRKFVAFVALDTEADRDKALGVLRKLA